MIVCNSTIRILQILFIKRRFGFLEDYKLSINLGEENKIGVLEILQSLVIPLINIIEQQIEMLLKLYNVFHKFIKSVVTKLKL